MALPLKPLTTTVIGGLVFLLPLIVVISVVGKGVALLAQVATPLATRLPEGEVGGVAIATLVTLGLLLLICYGAGMLARAAVGRRMSESFENRLHALYPRYTVIKAMTQGLRSDTDEHAVKPVLVTFDDHQCPAMEVERTAEGRVVVFLPGAPDPWSGNVVVVRPERVEPLGADMPALNRSLKGLGRGCRSLLDGAHASRT